jgi:hypothetical protein
MDAAVGVRAVADRDDLGARERVGRRVFTAFGL